MSQPQRSRLPRGALAQALVWFAIIAFGILVWVAVGKLLVDISAWF